MFYLFFYLQKFFRCENTADGFKIFLLPRFCFVFLPTTLNSLHPEVMLLSRSTAPRDSATAIEKTSQKGTLQRERPNRSVVKKKERNIYLIEVEI